MNFKGIIFDLDGTLVDSLEDLSDSMNTVLRNFNFPVHEVQAYKTFIGNGLRNLVFVTLPEANRDEQTVAKCYNQMVEIYNHNCLNKTKPYDGIIDLLNELKSRNIKSGVFSNKSDEFTKRIVQTLLPGYFEIIMGFTTEAYKKPNPSGALQISEKFGIAPEYMMYVGDSSIDMQTAKNAGMYAIGVSWGFRSREELISNGARCILEHPMDLVNLL